LSKIKSNQCSLIPYIEAMKLYCSLPAIPCRSAPSDRSEMTTQMLFGETATLLDENEKWFLVKTDYDQYECWVDRKQLTPLSEEEFIRSKNVATARSASLFSSIKNGDQEITVPFGSAIGHLNPLNLTTASQKAEVTGVPGTLTQSAMLLLGCPYLWGGRTPMGYDCSGFVQIIYAVHGIQLPRDAKQQAEVGDTIAFLEEARAHDLAFFENDQGKITHVGMLIDNHFKNGLDVIHASGMVRVDKFDHQGIFNSAAGTYTHNLRIIKRVSQL